MLRSIISRKSTVFRHASNLNHGVQKLGLGVQNIRFSSSNVVVSFKKVSFGYDENKLLLENVDFNIREGAKVTIMGQNGAGKSSIIKLLNGQLVPSLGDVNLPSGSAVSTAMQVMPRDCRDLTILDFFIKQLHGNDSGIASRIAKVLTTVQLVAPYDRIIKSFSGGQQARLLLAAALIVEPDILLLDEPTNNLDTNGINHLKELIMATEQTCVVISHDEEFLNSFSDSVLYLDVFSKKVEQYEGDYNTVKTEITKRIAKENRENAQLVKAAQAKKDQANVFANKGGGMRKVAKKMRDLADKMESDVVTVRKEDNAIKPFIFPFETCRGALLEIEAVTTFQGCAGGVEKKVTTLTGGAMTVDKRTRIRLKGPNGIGKTTFLEEIANGTAEGVELNSNATVGYYRQDFNTLDFDSTGLRCLEGASNGGHTDQEMRTVAAAFLLKGDMLKQKVVTLSEGQKGLLSFACLVLQRPSLLILDEPTNHINFRHLPAIAKAIKAFEGGVLLVSHDEDFVHLVGIDQELDLGWELKQKK